MSRPFSALPKRSRPRERLVREGAGALSETELVALLMRSGTHGSSANDLATELLAEFGTLRRISSASAEELARLDGVGLAKAAAIVAAFELGRRLSLEEPSEVVLARASDVASRARDVLAGLRRERVVVFVCDRKKAIAQRGALVSRNSLASTRGRTGSAQRCSET